MRKGFLLQWGVFSQKFSMIKRIFLSTILFFALVSLSGCTQEPAEETVKNKSLGNYQYLSKALEANNETEKGNAQTNPSGQIPNRQATPQSKTVGNNNQQPPPPPPPPSTPAEPTPPTETKPAEEPKPAEETKKESGPEEDTELFFVKKYGSAIIKTSKGDITVKFYNDDAPKTVNNFFKLASKKFYDGIRFHRIIEGFIIQAGDPNSKDDNWADDGQGGPGYAFNDEINSHKLIEGSFAMANAGPNTNGSQFFIVTAKSTPLLDGKYTNFGEVTDGMDVVRKIEKVDTDPNDHPKENIEIKSIKFIEKE